MSKYYAESNNESTKLLFNKRTMYRKVLSDSRRRNKKNVRDFNLGENCYYGKMDNYFSPIYLPSDTRNLKKLPTGQSGDQFQALNFVADLFNEMSMEFQRCAATGQIIDSDKYLSNLKVYKAYSPSEDAYSLYLNKVTEKIKKLFNLKEIKVEDFPHFLEKLMEVIPLMTESMPFTFTAFVKSSFNTVMNSGLAIEIADLSYENDDDKQNSFIESPNWDFFVNACNKYGFVIDYNVPWRIICDIKAPQIQQYIAPYGYNDGDHLINNGVMGFRKASLQALSNLAKNLLHIYNAVRKPAFIKTKYCDGKIVSEKVKPKSYTLRDIYDMYDFDSYIIPKLYILIRLYEEGVDDSDDQKRLLIKDILKYIKITEEYLPIETLFERFLNKPFDKPYTIDYYIKVAIPALKQQQFETGVIKALPRSAGSTTGPSY